MSSLFQRNLDRLRYEILALKTAHNRGLDTTRFYKYKLSIFSYTGYSLSVSSSNFISGSDTAYVSAVIVGFTA